jgi:hypothetical protein
VKPSGDDGEPDHPAAAVLSRALFSHSSRRLDNQFDLSFLEQIYGFTAFQPTIRLRQKIKDSPRAVGQ